MINFTKLSKEELADKMEKRTDKMINTTRSILKSRGTDFITLEIAKEMITLSDK